MKLTFATSNANKLREARELLGFNVSSRRMELDEIQSVHTGEVARHKAVQAYRRLRVPVIVEDTGLYINGFGGFPGALVKWLEAGMGYERVCRIVDVCEDRGAYAETCIAFYDGKRVRTFTGRINGRISANPKGRRNFGWDCIFIPDGHTKTFAEMPSAEKNRISMRRRAFAKLHRFLAGKNFV